MELLGLPIAGSLVRENIPTELRFPPRFCAALLQFFQLQRPSWRCDVGCHCGQDFWNSTCRLAVVNRSPNTRFLRGSLCFQRSTYRPLLLRRRAFGCQCGQDFSNSTCRLAVVNRSPNTRFLRGNLCFQRSTYRPLLLSVLQGFVDAAHIFVSSESTQAGAHGPLPSSRLVKSWSDDSVGEKLPAPLAIAARITDPVSRSENPDLTEGAIGSIRSSSNSRATS